ncbi:MAG: hypothetical protein HY216_16355 [Candidatus Rokubacteria bacterium]|nr:hypothetical protein [Candidatus Rokubacteria bacterium]
MNGDKYDRHAQDVGNILSLEHCNVRIPDQIAATNFYVSGLGLTRDPYLMVGTENMWINIGERSQIHMPTGNPQVFPGHIGLVTPDLDALAARLASVREKLAGTKFSYERKPDHVVATCPWGNRFWLHAPAPEFGETTLGMPYVEFPVRRGDADGIARFYREIMDAPATVSGNGAGAVTRVQVGWHQTLVFREVEGELTPYDGHHVAVYVADFGGSHKRLLDRGLVSQESNEVQYRFVDIVDPATGRKLFQIEHEVRSASHPMYLRPLVNRNPSQRQATYQKGRDAFTPGMA